MPAIQRSATQEPPQNQANATANRFREVPTSHIGMEVVARPTLRPEIKLGIILRTNFRPRSRVYHPELSSNYVRFGSNAGKRSPENVGAGVVDRLLAVHGGSVRLCRRVIIAGVG